MARYQMIDTNNRKTNIIEWDGVTPLTIPDHTIEPDDGTPIWTPVPTTVTPLQARKAIRAIGLMPAVKAFLETQPEEIQEQWEFAVSVERENEVVQLAATNLGLTNDHLDDLFRLASTL